MALRGWFMILLIGAVLHAEDARPPSPQDRAVAALKAGQYTNAFTIISDALKADPKDARLWNFRAQMRSLAGDSSGAVADLTEGIRQAPDSAFLHQDRAVEKFKQGQLTEALSDFDRANELNPQLVPYNWQRGIALYYGRRYADGRKQFEAHQMVNPNDVENAVWHFLCVARAEGTNSAHQALMPIASDERIPMVEIHELFSGEGTEEEVLEAAEEATGAGEEKRQAKFYAHLYLGLYNDVLGRGTPARDHLQKAVALSAPKDFMGHVARFHLNRFTVPAPNTSAP
jgi:lipoprotein NlpI